MHAMVPLCREAVGAREAHACKRSLRVASFGSAGSHRERQQSWALSVHLVVLHHVVLHPVVLNPVVLHPVVLHLVVLHPVVLHPAVLHSVSCVGCLASLRHAQQLSTLSMSLDAALHFSATRRSLPRRASTPTTHRTTCTIRRTRRGRRARA